MCEVYRGGQRGGEELGEDGEREAGATLAAGVFEVGDRRRDCGHSAPITSTHLLPYPATSCFGCMLCTQHPAASAPPPPHPHAT